MSDNTGDDNKKDNAKAVHVTPGGKPRVKSLAGMGAFKDTGHFNKLMDQKKSQHMNKPATTKPVIIKQVVHTPAPEDIVTQAPVVPEVKADSVLIAQMLVAPKVDESNVTPSPVKPTAQGFEPIARQVKTEQKSDALVEEKSNPLINFQPPQAEVLNTPKAAVVAKSEGFQAPQIKVLNTSQPPHQTPQNKVFDQPVKKALNNVSNQSVSNHKFRGNTLAIIRFLFDEVLKNGGADTGRVTMPYIAERSGVPKKSTEKLLSQLTKEGVLNVIEVRVGNGGYRVLSLSPNVFNYMANYSVHQTPYQTPHFPPSKEVSKFNNNITNYTQQPVEGFNTKNFNFKDLDFTEVAPLHPMQVNSSIRKLAEEKLEKEEMQLFVDKFMVWMSTQKNVQSVIGLFVSKIKEYIEEGDSPVMLCLSKKELIAEQEFKVKADQLHRQAQMTEKYRNEVEAKALDERFNEWISTLSNDDKVKYAPESNLAKLGSAAHNGALKAFYIENQSNNQ